MAVNELDARTRAVEKMKADPGKEMAAYQAAENQLLAIRAEQKQNLATARQEGAAALQQNATIGQAAELAAGSGGGAATVQAPVNAATQNVLAKYGAGPTITKSTQRTTQQVTKQNITINNYNTTTNNTTNNVPNTGPVQGRPVVVNRDDTGRFKVWVSNALARQNEQAAIRDKEYQRRESALTRSANKMTRKLEAISGNLSKALDPRRQATTFGEQLKRVLKLVGIGVIAANWPKMLDIIGNIEKKTRSFLRYVGITGRDDRKKTGADTGLVRDIKYILLGDRAKEVKGGLFGAVKEFFAGKGGLLETIKKSFKLWLDNRSKAIKAINPPDFSILKPGQGIKSLMTYLGQVLGVLLEGPAGAVKKAAERAREEGSEEMTTNKDIFHKKSGNKTASGKHVSYGDAASAIHDVDSAGAKYHVMREDLKEDGSLRNNLGASLRQSSYLADNFSGGKATGGAINVSGILEGLSRLEKTAKESKDKVTLVDPKFIKALEKLGVNIEALNLKDKSREYGYYIRKKTDDEKAEEFAQNSGLANAVGWTGGVTAGTLAAFFASGGGINAAGSVAAGATVGNEVKKQAEQWAQAKASEEYVYQLAPRGKFKDEQYAELKQEAGKKRFFNYYELTSEDMQEIKSQLGKLTGRNEEFSYDAEDVASTRAMADLLLKKNPGKKLDDSYARNMQDLTKLEGEMAEYNAAQKEIWDNSVVSGIGTRAGEVGGKIKTAATTGYTQSIGGNDAPITTKFKETSDEVGNKVKNTIDRIRPKEDWNVDKAVNTIKQNALSGSSGACLRYTGNAVSAGFGETTPIGQYHTSNDPNLGGITSAKYSGVALEALGFERIPNDSVLQKGDIHVFQPSNSWIAEGHPHGHIEMFDGSGWYSDFAQKSSGINWGHYSSMATYRWKKENVDGDVIETAPLGPGNSKTPTGIISSQEALAQNTSPIGDGTSHTPQNDAWAKANNMIWDEEEGCYIPNFGLDEVTVTPTSTTINTPLLADNTGFTTSDIARSTQTGETGNNSQGIENRLDVLIQATQNIEGISSLTAEATARNVDATTELAAVTAAKGNTPPPMSSSSPYTSGIPSGQV